MNGICQPCLIPNCELGQGRIECTRNTQSYCVYCPELPIGIVYIIPGECNMEHTRFLPPCPIGHYPTGWYSMYYNVIVLLLSNYYCRYCSKCPIYTSTNIIGAKNCSCWEGFHLENGICIAINLDRANYTWMLDGSLSIVDYSCRQGELYF